MTPPSRIDRTISLVVLAVLVIGVFRVLQPFLSAIAWAGVLAATTWPVYAWLRHHLRSSTLGATVMTLIILTIVVAPFLIVGLTAAENFDRINEFVRGLIARGPPAAPAWLAQVPLVGERAIEYWDYIFSDSAQMLEELKRLAEPARDFAIKGGAVVGEGLLQLTLSVLVAYFLYRDGEAIMARVRSAVSRIAPARGLHMLEVAGATTRAVVYGILGTALAQGILMAIGLYIVGIRAAPLLGLVTFFLSPVPIGPPLVWIPVGLWLILSQGETGWGIFLLIWGALVVSSVDNVLKPILISKGSDLPFILVMLGVFGGVIAFGFIGVFLGPVLLALAFAMIKEWAAPAPPLSLPPPDPD